MSKVKSAILSVIGPKLLPTARIISSEAVGPSFCEIILESEAFRGLSWSPGAKVQIDTGQWNLRTYTPVAIDPAVGHLKILAFLPGLGPASAWARALKKGDTTHVKGPDGSIQFPQGLRLLILFGDETSFGLAAGVKTHFADNQSLQFIFEVSSPESVQEPLRRLNLSDARIFPKMPGSRVHPELMKVLLELHSQNIDQVVLSGCAQSIQEVRKSLQTAGLPASRMLTKVYWSQGREGLD